MTQSLVITFLFLLSSLAFFAVLAASLSLSFTSGLRALTLRQLCPSHLFVLLVYLLNFNSTSHLAFTSAISLRLSVTHC